MPRDFVAFCCDDFAAFAAKAGGHNSIKILLGAKPGTCWYSVTCVTETTGRNA
jgi:hypothetical protein